MREVSRITWHDMYWSDYYRPRHIYATRISSLPSVIDSTLRGGWKSPGNQITLAFNNDGMQPNYVVHYMDIPFNFIQYKDWAYVNLELRFSRAPGRSTL